MTNRLLLFFVLLASLFTIWQADAQNAPQGFSYQCIVRDINGASLNNQTVSLLFTIRNGAPNGTVAYSEMQSASTNAYGLVNLVIGQGTALQGNFNTINWGASAKYLTVSLETAPSVFDELGTSQLMSVPYALYAQNTSSAGDNWGTQTAQTSPVLSGNGTSSTPLTIAQQGAQPGQVLKWDGTTWIPQDDNTGQSGTVSEVNTGAGLTGGPITSTGTISLANSPVTPGVYGSPTEIPVVTVDQYGRVTNVSLVSIPQNSTTITGAAGIGVTQNGQNFTITNTGDTNATDDLTTSTLHDGDVAGPYSNLQIKAGAVGNAEITDNAVGTSKITDGAVTTAKIADNAVSTAKIADGAVNTSKIADNAVSTAKIANASVTAAKLNDMGAVSGQVLKWTGTMWAPAQDALGSVSLTGGTGITISGASPNFTITNSGDTNANDDITTASQADGDVSGPFANLQIKSGVVGSTELANNAVTTSKINAQAVSGDKIDQMSAANGQVLKWNGTTWAPAPDNLGTVTITGGVGIDVIAVGQNFTIANGGDINPFDDLTTNSTADGDVAGPFSNLQIKAGAVNSFDLANNAVQTAKIQNAAVTGDKIAQMGAFNGQVLKWNGTTWAPAADTGGDNWGTQTVVTTAALSGVGTVGSPLTIDQQGATSGQVLKWSGAAWLPANDNNSGPDNWGTQTAATNPTLLGNGTLGSPLGIAPQGAANGQVLKFNGLTWAPADDQTGADNWGAQTAQVNPRLTGNGTAANPLDIAPQGAVNGQVLKFNGTTWTPANDNNSGADNWGTQTAQTSARLTGNGTAGTPLDLAQQGAANGQVLKWNGSAWTPANDNNTGGDNWGTQSVASSLNLDGDGTAGDPLRLAQFGATNGQVLKWDQAQNLWVPANDIGGGAGDDWGNQVAQTNATLTGNGTALNPLGIAAQGATTGQVLKFNGTTWVPQNEAGGDDWGNQVAVTSLNIIGNGTAANPLRLENFGANNGQVLSWNSLLNLWVPANDTWGTQTAAVTPRLSGNGTAGSPLDIASQGAATGQILKFNGTTWVPADDEVATPGSGDNWGTQSVVSNATLSGNGTNISPLTIATQGAANGQVLKFNGTTWAPADDNNSGNNYAAGAGIAITGSAPNFTIINTGDGDANPTNELQTLSLAGQDLTLSNGGGTVTLPAGNNYSAGAGIAITGSAPNFTIENTGDADSDSTNELQTLSLNGSKLAISGTGSEVDFDTLLSGFGGGLWTASGANIHNANAGFVGVATATPVRPLHVKGMGEVLRLEGTDPAIGFAGGANPSASISKSSGGFTVASEDSTSIILATGAGKTVFVDGLTGHVGMGAPNGSTARLRLFHAAGNAGLSIQNSNSGGEWDFRVNGFDGSLNLHNNLFGGGFPVGTFATNGFYTPSDRRFKKDITATGSVLDKVSRLNAVYYRYNQEKADAKRTIGFVAQEVEALFPELVVQNRTDDGSIYLAVNYGGFGVLAIKAIQEQQEEINSLRNEKDQLQKRLQNLEARVLGIEQARASREK